MIQRSDEGPERSEWEHLADAWVVEVEEDVVFATDVAPLVSDLMVPIEGRWLDLGCGEGRVMRAVEAPVIGCDLVPGLLRTARSAGPVVRCDLSDLGWLRSGAVAGAYGVLVLEHLADVAAFLAEVHRVVAPGGALVVVANHPAFTAEGAGPIVDLGDGEVLWRWGPYFTSGPVQSRLGNTNVTFHHRSLGHLLSAAAASGWTLELLEERPLSKRAIDLFPGYEGQNELPRLLGARWSRSAH